MGAPPTNKLESKGHLDFTVAVSETLSSMLSKDESYFPRKERKSPLEYGSPLPDDFFWLPRYAFDEADDYMSYEPIMNRKVFSAKTFYDPNIFYFASRRPLISQALAYAQQTKVHFDLCARFTYKNSIRSGCWIPFYGVHYFGFVTRILGPPVDVKSDCFRLKVVTDNMSAVTAIQERMILVLHKKLALERC